MKPLRIALVVQGRFHAFDLARGLARRGHDVTIFTNYPAWAAARFDVAPARVRSYAAHGVGARALDRVPPSVRPDGVDAWMHRRFGQWAAGALAGESWDVIHGWSGVSEEWLTSPRVRARYRVLMRGSAHVAAQDALLRDEAVRTGTALDRPSPWMIARETREYALADEIIVLSAFARRTFEARGYPAARLRVLPLGVDVAAFRASPAAIADRLRRIRDGRPLRVLYAGALSLRKGLWDLDRAWRALGDLPMELHLVGGATPEAASVLARLGERARVHGHVPQRDLPPHYWGADLFVFPTIEDGFGMVLTQAQAAGLPIVCSDHCAGPDLVRDQDDGWVLPIRSPDTLAARLRWCHAERAAFGSVAARAAEARPARDWADVAEAFEAIAIAHLDPAPQVHSA